MTAKIMLLGNLGRDAETRYTKSGTMNVTFSVASNSRYPDASGEWKDRTTWFRVTGWGKLAERLDKQAQAGSLAKGRQVLVTGKLEQTEYTNQQGETRTNLDLTADDVVLVGGGGGDGQSGGGGGYQREPSGPASSAEDIDELPF
ncbi:MAG TPA: single-stranded DNA-binding protein [Thermomicrobiales bacterium]|nr:single-stranded DNA-binding protein [Thermomicrobiales bacterium]